MQKKPCAQNKCNETPVKLAQVKGANTGRAGILQTGVPRVKTYASSHPATARRQTHASFKTQFRFSIWAKNKLADMQHDPLSLDLSSFAVVGDRQGLTLALNSLCVRSHQASPKLLTLLLLPTYSLDLGCPFKVQRFVPQSDALRDSGAQEEGHWGCVLEDSVTPGPSPSSLESVSREKWLFAVGNAPYHDRQHHHSTKATSPQTETSKSMTQNIPLLIVN